MYKVIVNNINNYKKKNNNNNNNNISKLNYILLYLNEF